MKVAASGIMQGQDMLAAQLTSAMALIYPFIDSMDSYEDSLMQGKLGHWERAVSPRGLSY